MPSWFVGLQYRLIVGRCVLAVVFDLGSSCTSGRRNARAKGSKGCRKSDSCLAYWLIPMIYGAVSVSQTPRTHPHAVGSVFKCSKVTTIAEQISDILSTMPNTTERREITGRANAKEAETIRQSDKLVAATTQRAEIASTKSAARRGQKRNGPSRERKNAP